MAAATGPPVANAVAMSPTDERISPAVPPNRITQHVKGRSSGGGADLDSRESFLTLFQVFVRLDHRRYEIQRLAGGTAHLSSHGGERHIELASRLFGVVE